MAQAILNEVPMPIQTLYAELVERAHMAQMAAKEFDPAGQFLTKTVKGRDHRSEKDSYKQRRAMVAALVRTGMKAPDPRTGEILEALANAGVFRMRAVIVGTAAHQTYSGLLGMKLANSNAMTDDLDIAQFGAVSVDIEDTVDLPFSTSSNPWTRNSAPSRKSSQKPKPAASHWATPTGWTSLPPTAAPTLPTPRRSPP
jgi:hypothetical protein